MHQQFVTLDSELVNFGLYKDVRARVKERYGGYMLATLVK
jgi:hypothetical protein